MYTYTEAVKGTNAGSNPHDSRPSKGERIVADIHSHGKYEVGYDNDNFSPGDKTGIKADGTALGVSDYKGYLTTPDGSLKEYDPATGSKTVISTDMPSDKNDPGRKNTINPTSAFSEWFWDALDKAMNGLDKINRSKQRESDKSDKIDFDVGNRPIYPGSAGSADDNIRKIIKDEKDKNTKWTFNYL